MANDHAANLDRLIAGTLTPSEFGHADHIGVAFEALSRWEFFEAAQRIATGIRSLAEAAGAPEKFNATITFAFLSLIAERMACVPAASAEAFIGANPDLLRSAFLDQLYSQQRLTSALARQTVLLPDRPAH